MVPESSKLKIKSTATGNEVAITPSPHAVNLVVNVLVKILLTSFNPILFTNAATEPTPTATRSASTATLIAAATISFIILLICSLHNPN